MSMVTIEFILSFYQMILHYKKVAVTYIMPLALYSYHSLKTALCHFPSAQGHVCVLFVFFFSPPCILLQLCTHLVCIQGTEGEHISLFNADIHSIYISSSSCRVKHRENLPITRIVEPKGNTIFHLVRQTTTVGYGTTLSNFVHCYNFGN